MNENDIGREYQLSARIATAKTIIADLERQLKVAHTEIQELRRQVSTKWGFKMVSQFNTVFQHVRAWGVAYPNHQEIGRTIYTLGSLVCTVDGGTRVLYANDFHVEHNTGQSLIFHIGDESDLEKIWVKIIHRALD